MKEISEFLKICNNLKEKYSHHKRSFTLDGKLVGDIGEVLAAEKYGLELLKENHRTHDAIELKTNRHIQIKASFKNNFYFPSLNKPIPDYFICINILENGEITEIYNGPGDLVAYELIRKKNKKEDSTGYTLNTNDLIKLNDTVPDNEKIKKVSN